MDKIKIGWSEVSLVPEGRKVKLCGQFYERITDEVDNNDIWNACVELNLEENLTKQNTAW